MIAYKTEFGDWAFDHEHENTIEEPLCNGTELVLDEYFRIDMNRNPKINDQIQIIVDTEELLHHIPHHTQITPIIQR